MKQECLTRMTFSSLNDDSIKIFVQRRYDVFFYDSCFNKAPYIGLAHISKRGILENRSNYRQTKNINSFRKTLTFTKRIKQLNSHRTFESQDECLRGLPLALSINGAF